MEILVNSIGKRNSFLGSEVSKKEVKMENKEVIAVISLIIVVICAIVLPRWYYKTHSTIDTVAIVTAIYTAAALEIGVLGGLIMAFRK